MAKRPASAVGPPPAKRQSAAMAAPSTSAVFRTRAPPAPPSFDERGIGRERSMFMSASSSKVLAAPREPERSHGGGRSQPAAASEKQLQRAEFKGMATSVELFGAAKLTGLARKDQLERARAHLGLAPVRDHKRPYKQLMALRKLQRDQDASAAALAKEAGMSMCMACSNMHPMHVHTCASG